MVLAAAAAGRHRLRTYAHGRRGTAARPRRVASARIRRSPPCAISLAGRRRRNGLIAGDERRRVHSARPGRHGDDVAGQGCGLRRPLWRRRSRRLRRWWRSVLAGDHGHPRQVAVALTSACAPSARCDAAKRQRARRVATRRREPATISRRSAARSSKASAWACRLRRQVRQLRRRCLAWRRMGRYRLGREPRPHVRPARPVNLRCRFRCRLCERGWRRAWFPAR